MVAFSLLFSTVSKKTSNSSFVFVIFGNAIFLLCIQIYYLKYIFMALVWPRGVACLPLNYDLTYSHIAVACPVMVGLHMRGLCFCVGSFSPYVQVSTLHCICAEFLQNRRKLRPENLRVPRCFLAYALMSTCHSWLRCNVKHFVYVVHSKMKTINQFCRRTLARERRRMRWRVVFLLVGCIF